MLAAAALAAAQQEVPQLSIPPLAVGVAWLALIVAITAGFVWFARRLRKRAIGDAGADASSMLAGFREAYEEGELSREEFQTIKQSLQPRLRAEVGLLRNGAQNDASRGRDWDAGAERSGGANASDQRETTVPSEESDGGGCEADQRNGGDSIQEGR